MASVKLTPAQRRILASAAEPGGATPKAKEHRSWAILIERGLLQKGWSRAKLVLVATDVGRAVLESK